MPFRAARILGVLLVAVLPFAGCSDDVVDTPIPNQVPNTHITSDSPRPFESTSFHVRLNWNGDDADGRVVGYYYAWDDTVDESGELRWQWIALSESTFTVSADSCGTPPCRDEQSPYFGYHTFWVKAVDDKGAHDPTPAYRTFTATTVAPMTTLEVVPAPCFCFYGESASEFVFLRWHGDDPDGSVVGYWYDWDRGQTDYPTRLGSPTTPDSLGRVWKFLPADSTTISARREEGGYSGAYRDFAIFAVDDAGAVEQVVRCPVNYTCWVPRRDVTGPGLCVDGGVLGVRSNPPSGARWCDPITLATGQASTLNAFTTVTGIFLGTPVVFRWGRLEYSDGREPAPLAGYQYSIDDPNAWSVLTTSVTRYPPPDSIYVPSEGSHVFYVRSVDRAGTIQQGAFRFEVTRGPKLTDPPPIPRVLLVDDTAPTDQFYGEWDDFPPTQEPAFWDSVLTGFGYDYWDTQISRYPQVPKVAQYTTVVWSAGNPGGTGRSWLSEGLFKVRAEYLTSYVRSGGNVLIVGMNPFWPMMIQSSEGAATVGDVCGFPPAVAEWMIFDPQLCGLTEETSFPHFLYTMLGVKQMHIPVANPSDPTLFEVVPHRMVRGAYPVDPAEFDTLRVDTLLAGGFSIKHSPSLPPGSAQYIPAPNTTTVTRMESWAHPIYYLNSQDPSITAAQEVVGIFVDGNENPRRRPSDPEWGKIAFLGFHPFFLKQEDAREFMRTILEDYFGEPYNP